MSCNCTPPDKSSLWTPIPQFRQPTDILPGENIDCFSRRSGDLTGLQDDARVDLENKVQNTSVTVSSNNGVYSVDETITLSSGPRTATTWSLGSSIGTLSISNSGHLTGTVPEGSYKLLVTAQDSNGNIDSREFNVVAAEAKKGESISLLIPYRSTNGVTPRVNSGFGPRMHPILKVMKLHKGQDWVGGHQGEILAAADGEVSFCGLAGGYGNRICINHFSADGKILCQTTYNHLSKIIVTRGQKVGAGQVIGHEGSTGASTGPHLHFEVLLGGKTPVDPAPYLRGSFAIQPPTQSNGLTPPEKTITNPPTGNPITVAEVQARTANDCPRVLDSGSPPAGPNTPVLTPSTTFENKAPTTSDCLTSTRPSFEEVSADINRALSEFSEFNNEDWNLIRFIAQIESRFDPFAKNPTSTATGLYQMLDKIAVKYYGLIGIPPTCVNRCNAYYATKAMAMFYKLEIKAYYDGYIASGKQKIAGRLIFQTPHSQRYPTLSKGEFCYGLVHHDGVGNAVRGIDRQGVDYYRKKIAESNFS